MLLQAQIHRISQGSVPVFSFETWPFGEFKVSSLEKDLEGEIVGTRQKGPSGAYSTGVQSAETPL